MDNISICVSFIATILGIAYPILLGVVSRLDEKYSSQTIVELFNKEEENIYFTLFLKVSLISLFIWVLKLPPLVKIDSLNYIISNSAYFMLIFSTVILIISFFYFVKKVLIYYTPTKYLPYLINRHNKSTNENDYDFFNAISDMLYFSIKNQNEKISKSISEFMYSDFKKIRDASENKEVIYPSIYYNLVYKTIEELAFQKNKRLTFLEHRTAGSVWLLGEYENTIPSEDTYIWIWRNLQLAIKYQRDDYVIYHWETAYQYVRQSLDYIYPKTDTNFEVTNQREIDLRLANKKKFLEFHYALGGLLLYKKQYNCIQRAFTYTQSIPPQYELLPDTMDEVFDLYFSFRDPYEMNHPWISSRYSFPELGGLNSDGIIKKWICKYVALLFLRQYSIVPHLITMAPLNFPRIPATQGEKRQWIDNLDYFKNLVGEILKDEEMLCTIGLNFITTEWCKKHKHHEPIEFIEKIKQAVIDSFEGTLIYQPVSLDKLQKFKETSIAILNPIFKEYEIINNINELSGDLNKWYLHSISHIIDKSIFADNQQAHNLNFDSFLPESFSNKFRDFASEIFVLAASKNYLLSSQDLVPAISKLEIDTKEYLIVSFGIDIKSLINDSSYEALKKIEIIKFDLRNYDLVGDSLFVLKRQDLPKLNYRKINEDEINKYSLQKAIDKYNLYVTVIDLNQSQNIRSIYANTGNDEELRKQVYMGIFISLEVQWKKDLECIRIKRVSPFRERGIVNNLTDVKALD